MSGIRPPNLKKEAQFVVPDWGGKVGYGLWHRDRVVVLGR
jgi:hypothetical protein